MPVNHIANVPIKPAYIRSRLRSFNNQLLKGLSAARMECLVKQIFDSTQRIGHITDLRNTVHNRLCTDATRDDFNPLRAAAYHSQQGNMDEAFWLVFLATHMGEDEAKTGWRLVKDVYCGLGNAVRWDWKSICSDPNGFRQWLKANKMCCRKTAGSATTENMNRFLMNTRVEPLHPILTGLGLHIITCISSTVIVKMESILPAYCST